MENIIEKITSYNLFNYLLPGVLFTVLLNRVTSYSIAQNDLIIAAFVYYFVGLVISRVGSLVVEPFLKWISFLKFASYSEFVTASKSDSKIEVLLETNNMYRTIIAMLLLLPLTRIYEMLSIQKPFLSEHRVGILVLFLLVIFLLSYKKQTVYIKGRVETGK